MHFADHEPQEIPQGVASVIIVVVVVREAIAP